jgi:hypothetical protein
MKSNFSGTEGVWGCDRIRFGAEARRIKASLFGSDFIASDSHPYTLRTYHDELLLFIAHISRMGMQLPAAWQGMPGQPQIPAAAQQMAAAAQGAAMQQPGGMMAYPMQQFQVLLSLTISGLYSPSNL